MSQYTFTLQVDPKVLAMRSPDNFCIAKKGKFTTVFQDASVAPTRAGQKSLLTTNNFQWEDKYQVSATANYQHAMMFQAATSAVDIKFGEETTFKDSDFVVAKVAATSDFTAASGPQSPDDSFLAKKVPNSLHVSVSCKAGNTFVPIYVDPLQHNGLSDHQLTPLNEYMLFWSSTMQTESMIDESKCSDPFVFSFTGSDKAKTVRYGFKTKDQPVAAEQPSFYDGA